MYPRPLAPDRDIPTRGGGHPAPPGPAKAPPVPSAARVPSTSSRGGPVVTAACRAQAPTARQPPNISIYSAASARPRRRSWRGSPGPSAQYLPSCLCPLLSAFGNTPPSDGARCPFAPWFRVRLRSRVRRFAPGPSSSPRRRAKRAPRGGPALHSLFGAGRRYQSCCEFYVMITVTAACSAVLKAGDGALKTTKSPREAVEGFNSWCRTRWRKRRVGPW